VARVEASVGALAFAEAWAVGQSMALDEVIAYAIATREAETAATAELTAREREVAVLIARGQSNREIAEALMIAERTAANHVEHILNKLGFHSRTQVATWVTEQRLLGDT
jgi:DNA-binding NarL/FixJ family response regulator